MKKSIFKYVCMALVIVFACGMIGCGAAKASDPVAQKVIDDIVALGEITLEDEDAIGKIEETYATLTDDQKSQVKNYIDVLNAKTTIEELKAAEEAKLEERASGFPEFLIVYAAQESKDRLKSPDSMTITGVRYANDEDGSNGESHIQVHILYTAENSMGGLTNGGTISEIYFEGDTIIDFNIYSKEDEGLSGAAWDNLYDFILNYHDLYYPEDVHNWIDYDDIDFIQNRIQ